MGIKGDYYIFDKVEIIYGGIRIFRTGIKKISFPNLTKIVTTRPGMQIIGKFSKFHEWFLEIPALQIEYNPYLTHIEFPKLERIATSLTNEVADVSISSNDIYHVPQHFCDKILTITSHVQIFNEGNCGKDI